jgi:hypothetical protein
MKVGFGFQWFPAMEGNAPWSRHHFYVVDMGIPVTLGDGNREVNLVFNGKDIFSLWEAGIIRIDTGVPSTVVTFGEKTRSLEIIITADEGEKGYAVEASTSEMEIWCQQILSSIERQLEEVVRKTCGVLKVFERLGFDELVLLKGMSV